ASGRQRPRLQAPQTADGGSAPEQPLQRMSDLQGRKAPLHRPAFPGQERPWKRPQYGRQLRLGAEQLQQKEDRPRLEAGFSEEGGRRVDGGSAAGRVVTEHGPAPATGSP